MRPSVWRWLAPVPACFALQAVYGLLFAHGVFVSALHEPAFTKAVGLVALFTALGITAFGIVLANANHPRRHRSTPRTIAILGSAGISAQVLMAFALTRHITWLLYASAALAGIGSGAVYVVSIVMLQAWVPESPGMVTGTGLLVGGGGSLFGIYAFQVAIKLLGGAIPAIAVAGVASGAVSVVASLFIQRPPTGWRPEAETPYDDGYEYGQDQEDYILREKLEAQEQESVVDDPSSTTIPMSDESAPLLSHKPNPNPSRTGTRLSVREILADPAFLAVFVSVSAAVGPGFGFVLAFPRMVNSMFGVELVLANRLFFFVTFVGVVGRILVGLSIDLLTPPADTMGYGFLGAKRINTALLALQSTALALMPICIRYGWTDTFALATAMVYVTFSGGAVVSACLARSVFSPENSTLAFALLGVAIGIGRALFSVIVASCGGEESNLVESVPSRQIYEYDMFVHAAFFVSAIGLISSYFVSPSKAVYQNGSNSPVFADSIA